MHSCPLGFFSVADLRTIGPSRASVRIYSFGILPYPGMDMKEVVDQVKQGYRMSKPDGCPENVFAIVLSCWEAEPDQRPSFATIKAQLEAC